MTQEMTKKVLVTFERTLRVEVPREVNVELEGVKALKNLFLPMFSWCIPILMKIRYW